ncbi:MAG TPA: TonB-dependent receptor [Candidatus Eisenbacteria bacterium]|nr:TonB-dependent receptor [Candidatus Eisenbacteria bacterium]
MNSGLGQKARVQLAVALVAVSVIGSNASAQDAAPVARATMDTVVVTATRVAQDALEVPAAIDRIDAADIARSQARLKLSESLSRVPGVLVRDRQNQAQDLQISIRGFGARSTFGVRGVRLYTDGIPATMPDGQGQVSHFLLDATERIEILRGPFSALYGNSSGGVIQIFSADPPAHGELRIGPLVGGDGVLRGALGWRGPWPGTRSGGYSIDGLSVSDDGFRDHSGGTRLGGQASIQYGLGQEGTLRAIANVLDARADDPQGLTASELATDRQAASPGAITFNTRKTTRQGQIGVRFENPFIASSRISLGAYAGSRAIVQFLSVPVAAQTNPLNGGGVVDLDRDYFGIDARARWPGALGVRELAITLGVEHQLSDEQRRGYENFVGTQLGVQGALRRNESNRVTATDEYVQAEWEPATRWRAYVGVRHSAIHFCSRDAYITAENPDDSGTLTYRKTTPVGGLLWRALPGLSLYANAGEGFETPTFSELAYRSDGQSGLNTNLRPARSDNLETGVRGRLANHRFAMAWFLTRTDDELAVASNQGGRTTFVNAAQSLRQGAEISWSAAWSPRWHYALAYTYLDARYSSGFGTVQAGSRIPGVPRHTGWVELRWLPGGGLVLALAANALDRVWANDQNTASAPGYVDTSVGVEHRWQMGGVRLTEFVRGNNLLDREVVGSVIVNESNGRYFEPAPGQHWLAGITVTLVSKGVDE